MKASSDDPLIDLRHRDAIEHRSPLLIAHRGGVIARNAPENSLAAIRLAANHFYDLVELDVTQTKDYEPVLFHGWKGHLGVDCGIDAYVHDLTSAELGQVRYKESDEGIPHLSQALALCRRLSLGVMLDIKIFGSDTTVKYFQRIGDSLNSSGITNACLTLSHHRLAREYFRYLCMFPLSEEEVERIVRGEKEFSKGRWWFALPEEVTTDRVTNLRQADVLIVAAINRFRYPAHDHEKLARRDGRRLIEMGVDGLQIDSIYEKMVRQEIQEGQDLMSGPYVAL